jgi:hypothetical protein
MRESPQLKNNDKKIEPPFNTRRVSSIKSKYALLLASVLPGTLACQNTHDREPASIATTTSDALITPVSSNSAAPTHSDTITSPGKTMEEVINEMIAENAQENAKYLNMRGKEDLTWESILEISNESERKTINDLISYHHHDISPSGFLELIDIGCSLQIIVDYAKEGRCSGDDFSLLKDWFVFMKEVFPENQISFYNFDNQVLRKKTFESLARYLRHRKIKFESITDVVSLKEMLDKDVSADKHYWWLDVVTTVSDVNEMNDLSFILANISFQNLNALSELGFPIERTSMKQLIYNNVLLDAHGYEALKNLQMLGVRWWENRTKIEFYLWLIHEPTVIQKWNDSEKKRNLIRLIEYLSPNNLPLMQSCGLYEMFFRHPSTDLIVQMMDLCPEWHLEDIIAVARYLDNCKKLPTTENMLAFIIDVRKEYREKEVLAPGREVIIFAHNEMQSEIRRFGKDTLFSQVEKITGKHPVAHLAPKQLENVQENRVQLKEFKQQVIDQIRNAPPGSTFLFEGHGSAEAFWFSAGEVATSRVNEDNSHYCISVEEMVQALLQRYENHSGHLELLSNDVFFISSCVSGTYIDEISRRLESKGVFIFISVTEFYLTGRSDQNALTGSSYTDNNLGLRQENPTPVLLLDVLERDREGTSDTNLRVIVPIPKAANATEQPAAESINPYNYIQIGMHQRWKSQDEIIS